MSIQLQRNGGAFETQLGAVMYRGEKGQLWITLPHQGAVTDYDGMTWRLNGMLTDKVHGISLQYGTLTLAVQPRR